MALWSHFSALPPHCPRARGSASLQRSGNGTSPRPALSDSPSTHAHPSLAPRFRGLRGRRFRPDPHGPDTQNTFNSGTSTTPFSTTAGLRQYIYDTTHFTNAGVTGPITITRLRVRAADGVKNLGGNVYAGATVQLGTAAVDYLAMSTTYATNRGAMGTLSSPFSLTTLPVNGTWTNGYLFDIDLAAIGASFPYDPTLGADLLVEFVLPTAPVPTTNIPAQACSSTTANGRAQRNAGTVAGPTGSLSGFAPVITFDFSGPGGYSAPIGSWVENRGASCGAQAQSFYQFTNFIGDSFGLRNGKSLLLTPDNPAAPNYYIVTGGTTLPDTSATALGGTIDSVADDAIVNETPGFTFNFPGGSTTSFSACTNGFVWLGTNTTTDLSPTVLEFLNSPARIAVAWMDQHAGRNTTTNPTSGMYVNTDLSGGPGNGVTYVTWNEIGQFNSDQPGANVNTFQAVFSENGTIELRYGAISGMRGSAVLTGFSRGGTTTTPCMDPGNRDLEVETPFTTTLEGVTQAMTLAPSARPFLSTNGVAASITHTVTNIPVNTVFLAVVVDFGIFQPGIPLVFGGAGCVQTVINPNILALTVAPVGSYTSPGFVLPLGTSPNAGGWMGAALYTQGVSLEDNGGILSTHSTNAIKLALGLL